MKRPNIRKGAFIRSVIRLTSGKGIHRITVRMTCYFNCGRGGDLKIHRLLLAINTGRLPYPGERAKLQGAIMIILPQGVPQI